MAGKDATLTLLTAFLHHDADVRLRHHLTYSIELPPLIRYELSNPLLRTISLDIEVSVSTLVQHILPPSATGESLRQLLHKHGEEHDLQIMKVSFSFVPEGSPPESKPQRLAMLDVGFDAHLPCLKCLCANNWVLHVEPSDLNPFCSKTTRFIQSVIEQVDSVTPHPVRQRVPGKPANERLADGTWLDVLAPFQDEDGKPG